MTQATTHQPPAGLNEFGRRRLIQVLMIVVIYAVCLFVPAGTLRWWNAWAYLGMFVLSILTAGVFVAWKNPAIVNERGRPSENTKPFDRLFARMTLPLVLGAFVVAGLDERFSWSAFPLWLQIIGLIGLLPSVLMPYWVMYVNRYAATTVRVELDRGQHVIPTGPYRLVRHPMYSAMILGCLFDPLAFDSWWMAIPVCLLIALIIWRTAHEDATLHEELPGYNNYAAQTRFRLVPGVW